MCYDHPFRISYFYSTLQEENAIFSGDCILGEGTAVFEDLYDYMSSLRKILELKPSVIYPAHGAVIEVIMMSKNAVFTMRERQRAIFFQNPLKKIEYYLSHRNEREKQILETLRSNSELPMTAMDIVKIVYTVSKVALSMLM